MPTPATNQIELRSDEVQEILSYMPNWMIRWGTTVILMVIILLLFMSYFIKYPDIVYAPVVLSTQSPPVIVKARATGKLVQLMAQEGSTVNKNDVLGIMENPADYQAVQELEYVLKQFGIIEVSPEKIDTGITLPALDQLGPLQNAYTSLAKSITDFRNYRTLARGNKRIQSIDQQIAQYRQLSGELEQQRSLLIRDIELAESRFERYRHLLQSGSIARQEVEKAEKDFLQAQQNLAQLETNIRNNDLQISRLKSNIIDTQADTGEQQQTLLLAVTQALSNLKSQYAEWEMLYVLKASINGTVSLPNALAPQQTIDAGSEVFTIIPKDGNTSIIGKLSLQPLGLGKVKEGQRVNIKLAGYPYHEFGILNANIAYISPIARAQGFEAEVILPKGMITNSGKTLAFRQGMQGTAEIITEDLRLIERIFNQLSNLLSNKS